MFQTTNQTLISRGSSTKFHSSTAFALVVDGSVGAWCSVRRCLHGFDARLNMWQFSGGKQHIVDE